MSDENKKTFKIEFSEIKKIIKITNSFNRGYYDKDNDCYMLDGIKFEDRFFNETISVFSNYINSITNMKIRITKNSQESTIKEKIVYDEKEVLTDTDGNTITYG